MEKVSVAEAVEAINKSKSITFLTGAGVSTPSGIPDYRSLKGIYQGIKQPEYLLSHEAMVHEPHEFHSFVKKIYHPDAQPNVIHTTIARLEKSKEVWTISQNIDGLHDQAGSQQLVNFHGTLYDCYCRKCGEAVSWQNYLSSDTHEKCGGQVRPAIVLYGEGFQEEVLEQAEFAVSQAELIVLVGTSFQVHPFCDLIHFRAPHAKILVINQSPIYLDQEYNFVQIDGMSVFDKIKELGADYDD